MKYLNSYSIKDLEELSGIKAHTIRIWEVRYGLLKPNRTDTNIRLYDETQLKRLLNITFLLKNGIKISKISLLSEAEINEKILAFFNAKDDSEQATDAKINSLVVAMIGLNEELFDSVFKQSVLQIGFEDTITQIIYPFLQKVGILWTINNIQPAQEHFISNLIRQKLITATDQQPFVKKPKQKWLLFLPEGEMHEIGLLLANYMIRHRKQQTIYLGQNVPIEDIVQVCEQYKPEFILTFITAPKTPDELLSLFKYITKASKSSKLCVSGSRYHFDFKLPSYVQYLSSVTDLIELLRN